MVGGTSPARTEGPDVEVALIILAVLIIVVIALVVVQQRRRSGGVIAGTKSTRRNKGNP